MARPRSEDKAQAILQAAIDLFAVEGLQAPTARIARQAGVAEGTLFTYFANKELLLNQVYLTLKQRLKAAVAMPADNADLRAKLWHAWQAYIGWGLASPAEYQVLAKLALSPQISEETRAQGRKAFGAFACDLDQAMALGGLRQQTPQFVAALMAAMADATIECSRQQPARAAQTCRDGFGAFWNALTGP